MNNRTLLYLSALLILLGAATMALADVPPRINFQGTLLDSEGNPVTTQGKTIRFFIYDQPTGGEWKWFEMQAVTPDAAGQFSVVLGTNEDIIDTVFNSPDRWLEIQVSSDPPMTPRIQLVSAGYAFRVSTVDGSTGGTITGDVSIQSDLDVNGDLDVSGNFLGNLRVTGKATIGPGHSNTGSYAFVAGEDNTASGWHSTVGGGSGNSVSQIGATIAGGRHNTIDIEIDGTIGGGLHNEVTSLRGVIAGGDECFVSGQCGSIGGGRLNRVEGIYSCIPGGLQDTVTGDYSMAFGYGVYNPHNDAALFYDGSNPGHLYVNRDRRDEGMIVFLHPLRVGTNTGNGNGAYLSEGGTWFNGSSRAFKENFQPLDGEELLAKIAALPVQSWNYKGTDEQHIGPVAEDFVAAFDVGTAGADGARENKYLSHGDVAGVALRGVQELTQQLAEKTKQAEQFETRVAQLEALIQKLMAERR